MSISRFALKKDNYCDFLSFSSDDDTKRKYIVPFTGRVFFGKINFQADTGLRLFLSAAVRQPAFRHRNLNGLEIL